jgi:hypothetical protein
VQVFGLHRALLGHARARRTELLGTIERAARAAAETSRTLVPEA